MHGGRQCCPISFYFITIKKLNCQFIIKGVLCYILRNGIVPQILRQTDSMQSDPDPTGPPHPPPSSLLVAEIDPNHHGNAEEALTSAVTTKSNVGGA